MIHKDIFNKVDFVGAKGLVFLGDRVVLYRRDMNTKKSPGLLDMIGGGREADETPFETFKRETKEEIGLDITESDIFSAFPFQSFDNPQKVSFFFATRPLGQTVDDIKFGNEGTEFILMTPEEYINRKDAIPRQQERVKAYLDTLKAKV